MERLNLSRKGEVQRACAAPPLEQKRTRILLCAVWYVVFHYWRGNTITVLAESDWESNCRCRWRKYCNKNAVDPQNGIVHCRPHREEWLKEQQELAEELKEEAQQQEHALTDDVILMQKLRLGDGKSVRPTSRIPPWPANPAHVKQLPLPPDMRSDLAAMQYGSLAKANPTYLGWQQTPGQQYPQYTHAQNATGYGNYNDGQPGPSNWQGQAPVAAQTEEPCRKQNCHPAPHSLFEGGCRANRYPCAGWYNGTRPCRARFPTEGYSCAGDAHW